MKGKGKGWLLAAFFAVIAAGGLLKAFDSNINTVLDDMSVLDLKLRGNDILDSDGTTRVTVGATNAIVGNVTVSGNATVTGTLTATGTSYFSLAGSTAPRDNSSAVGLTPTAAGQLAYNITDRELCLSTGTTRFTWVQVSSGSVTACTH